LYSSQGQVRLAVSGSFRLPVDLPYQAGERLLQ
jgi:hypothetical protein